ncbi:hypothetical protein [Candidatus Soleaferrea massiliensis]|uniref:hypothetical protein n=1 Tax=Candidatus Soleaferrea massiliensis TaxID=1470354 RepID=UPI0012E022F4|nr:hypothetical protein [Candidatus Soleaferrea massiliensis]
MADDHLFIGMYAMEMRGKDAMKDGGLVLWNLQAKPVKEISHRINDTSGICLPHGKWRLIMGRSSSGGNM